MLPDSKLLRKIESPTDIILDLLGMFLRCFLFPNTEGSPSLSDASTILSFGFSVLGEACSFLVLGWVGVMPVDRERVTNYSPNS